MSKTPTTLLRLYLPANWPSKQTSCEWQLLNTHGALLQSGASEPRHWPAADCCELILTAAQCLLTSVGLPKTARARTAEVIGYALEEQLLGDAANEHFVVGHPLDQRNASDSGVVSTPVWVIARQRLQTLLDTLRTLGHTPQRLVSELQLLPLSGSNHWSLCLKPDGGFLRTGSETGCGCSFDLPGGTADALREPPAELRLALSAARKTGTLPSAISVYSAPGSKLEATQLADWQASLGLPVQLAGEYRWRDYAAQIASARNLLTGEFTPARAPGEGWSSLRPALWLGALALLIYSLFSFGEWAWLSHEKNQLRQQMTVQFRSSFPQAQTIIDPPLQMQRLHDQLLRERGQPGADDFLSLLAAASAALPNPSQLKLISYAEGRLELSLILADANTLQQLRNNLQQRGLTADIRNTQATNSGIEATLILRNN
jgi:general secretion pathway protein L